MILALDYGEKRIGIAVTDESERFVRALDFVPNKSELKKIHTKDFPKGTKLEVINDARKAAKREAKIEFRKVCSKLLHLINLYYPDKLLIGLPLVPDKETGQLVLGAQAKKIKQFVKKLESYLKQNNIVLDIEFIEESLSSQIAEKRLRDEGVPSSRINERIDSESARVMLEEYLGQLAKNREQRIN